jgi:translation initiation factor IF-2
MTDEIKQKISNTLKGKPLDGMRKEKIIKRNKENPPMLGKKHTEKTKAKMRKVKENISKETRAKMSKSQKGRKHSKESKQKMSEARQGENNPMYGKKQKRVKCSYCGTEGAISGMTRWHGKNCKLNDDFWEEW